jgi:hypothetical protein
MMRVMSFPFPLRYPISRKCEFGGAVMLKEQCPGSREIRNPFPEDLKCVYCDTHNEIWSDETETECKDCKHTIDREMKANCLLWCPAAKECVGKEKYDRLKKAMKG